MPHSKNAGFHFWLFLVCLLAATLLCVRTVSAAAKTKVVDDTREMTVVIPPNILGTKTFVAMPADDERCVVVRAYGSSALPNVSSGDRVLVTGHDGGVSRGLPLVSTSGAKVVRTASGTVQYATLSTDILSDAHVGRALALSGIVVQQTKRTIVLSDTKGAREIGVTLPPTAKVDKVTMGAPAVARGVIVAGPKGPQVLLAAVGDLEVHAMPVVTGSAPKSETGTAEAGKAKRREGLTPVEKKVALAVAGAAAVAAATGGIWAFQRKRRAEDDLLA